jgi:hypothetical protein
MSGYLIALPSPIEPVVTRPEMMPVTIYTSDQEWHVYLSSSDTTEDYAGSKLIGGWDDDGIAITSLDFDFAEYLQPAGLIDGEAPTTLAINNWLGAKPERAVQETPVEGTLPQFPADAQPYQVTATRTNITDDGFAQIPHGFTFRIAFAAPDTQPTARSFGVYSDAECTQYLWTPGAFVNAGTDDDGNTIWQINCPVGQRTAEPQEWHFAMLLGAAQVGKFTLPVGQESTTRYFFEANRGEWGGGVSKWAAGTSYAVNDQVTYLGITYRCLQAHTAIVGWYPNVVPALWAVV